MLIPPTYHQADAMSLAEPTTRAELDRVSDPVAEQMAAAKQETGARVEWMGKAGFGGSGG